MDTKLTVGSATPAQGINYSPIAHSEVALLLDTIKSIDKRLENIEKALSEIQQSSAKTDETKTASAACNDTI